MRLIAIDVRQDEIKIPGVGKRVIKLSVIGKAVRRSRFGVSRSEQTRTNFGSVWTARDQLPLFYDARWIPRVNILDRCSRSRSRNRNSVPSQLARSRDAGALTNFMVLLYLSLSREQAVIKKQERERERERERESKL